MVGGLDEAGRAPFSVGYVNTAAFVILAFSAFFVAPLGARLAHALPERQLRRAFAVALLLVAINMIREAVIGG